MMDFSLEEYSTSYGKDMKLAEEHLGIVYEEYIRLNTSTIEPTRKNGRELRLRLAEIHAQLAQANATDRLANAIETMLERRQQDGGGTGEPLS